jgi:hypothetical protein
VVISDASHLDHTAARLAHIYRDDPAVTVISRPGKLGWIEHANLLLAEAGTELFCWMPQDDLVFPDDYFQLLVGALDRDREGVLAFPTVLRRVSKGWTRREAGLAPFRSPPAAPGADRREDVAVKLLRSWNLGLAWRGVFRTSVARSIPETSFAPDVLWAFSMALAGSLVWVPEARYVKRFHKGSALNSMPWQGKTTKRLYRIEIESRLADRPERTERVMKQVSLYLALYRFRRQYMLIKRSAAGLFGLRRTVNE